MIPTEPNQFRFLEERFIQCVFVDGSRQRVSLLEACQQAGKIEDLRHDSGQDDFAIYRFLLAVLISTSKPRRRA